MFKVLSCDSDSTRQRWLEASYSRLTSDNPEEKLYEEWDCPQVLAVHVYTANQPDELSLQNGDVVKVLKKTTDVFISTGAPIIYTTGLGMRIGFVVNTSYSYLFFIFIPEGCA
ncbi:Rho guanine nucleotide exchange factor 26 [Sarracenia purpurea var. burkii]